MITSVLENMVRICYVLEGKDERGAPKGTENIIIQLDSSYSNSKTEGSSREGDVNETKHLQRRMSINTVARMVQKQ